jgi:hypothetical protein
MDALRHVMACLLRVSMEDVVLYVNELSVLDGFTPVYEPDGFGFYLRGNGKIWPERVRGLPTQVLIRLMMLDGMMPILLGLLKKLRNSQRTPMVCTT